MKKSKQQLLKELKIAQYIIENLNDEISLTETDKNGIICSAYNGEYSLEKIKRYCTTIREIMLEIKQSC